MRRFVLDASAMMALFDERPGADKVEDVLADAMEDKASLLMSVVNWGEIYYSIWLGRGSDAARSARAEMSQLPVEIIDADTQLTALAVALKAKFKLPYAGCFAAALAMQRKATLVTSDADFAAVKDGPPLLWLSR